MKTFLSITSALAALSVFAALPAPATPLAPAKPKASLKSFVGKSGLAGSRTVRVQEVLSLFETSPAAPQGKFQPFLHSDIVLLKPHKTLETVRRITRPRVAYLTLSDGKKRYNYNGFPNLFYTRPAEWPETHDMISSIVSGITQLPVLRTGKLPAADAGTKRVVTTDVLDGKAMILTTDTSATDRSHWWVDAKTHLPYRMIEDKMTKGQWIPQDRRDFFGWQINAPVADSQFAWTPPPGAKWETNLPL